ncbi:MarR family transcriptional regulator [Arthrobacter sp. zg-Y20]|uniref:MarR family winged helix-turn-helix transcriptional regulator n=1 Tax=unclassified Arthrobacter TaxID=235627 RepID=UPI001D13DD02|nr:MULTISPECIES: MarR family transcriptional regulator [unclassified Arthrobacter]MCC3277366.1 MarR family transcriptional regulator [Arthrobacter sp. zg-Y20]MDK1317526.1 MarR family transcriptional regulator [Arthrobacter sp. zg.Y20]WIB06976.1 MarR family transcriptional regulator [Arthrobacter sp. zg-Y20]
MTTPLNEDELAAYFVLRAAGDRLQRAVTQQLRTHGLTEVQFSILAQLSSAPDGVGMSELAGALVVTKSGLSYQAGQLEGKGLVARTSDAADERAIRLTLTPAGLELIGRVLPDHVALVRDLFIDRLDSAELATVRASLAKVARG